MALVNMNPILFTKKVNIFFLLFVMVSMVTTAIADSSPGGGIGGYEQQEAQGQQASSTSRKQLLRTKGASNRIFGQETKATTMSRRLSKGDGTKKSSGKGGAKCSACKDDPTYVFNSGSSSYYEHKEFANRMGCELASIHSPEEATAALEATGAYNIGNSWFVFVGGIKTTPNQGDPVNEIWTWEDGSGTFTTQEWKDNGLLPAGEPNSGPAETALALLLPNSFIGQRGQFLDIRTSERRPAIYTCCSENLNADGDDDFFAVEEGEEDACWVVPPDNIF